MIYNTDKIIGNGVNNTFTDIIITGLSGNIITTESVKTSIEELDSSLYDMVATGVCSWGGTGNYYSVAGTTFTLLRPGDGRIKGKNITWLGSQNITLVANACNYIYINNTGTLAVTQVDGLSLYNDNILLFEALYDGTNVFVVKEDHTCSMQSITNYTFHNTIGTVITTSTNNQSIGADITRVATGGGGAAGDRQLKIVGEAFLQDHGLITTIPDSAGSPETINWYYTNASGYWVRYAQQTEAPMYWNNAGTPTLLGAGDYGNFRIYVSKDDLNSVTPTYFAVMGTAEYNNSAQALAAVNSGEVASYTNELYQLELAQLGYITVDNSGGGYISNVEISKRTAVSGITTGSGSALASGVNTNITNFDKLLSATDTTVQAALETIDDYALDKRGQAGGQIIYGGTASGENLTLNSTAHATRGYISIPEDRIEFGNTVLKNQLKFHHPDSSGSGIVGYSDFGGFNSIEMQRNYYLDGVLNDFYRYDIALPASGWVIDEDGDIEYWTAAAGANPIANWVQQSQMRVNGATIWNWNYNDADFQVRAVGQANALFVQGSDGFVGIGLTPTANMAGLSIEAGLLTLKETTTPTADTDYGKVYTKNDDKLYFQDGAGVEHEVAFV